MPSPFPVRWWKIRSRRLRAAGALTLFSWATLSAWATLATLTTLADSVSAADLPPAETATVAAAAEAPAAPAVPPAAVRPDAEVAAQLLAAVRDLNLVGGFRAGIETHGELKDNKLEIAWSTAGDLTWRRDNIYEFHLNPSGSAYRRVHGLAVGRQRYLVFPDDGRYATRAMAQMNPSLTEVLAGTEGEHYLFNSLHRLALLIAPAAAPVPAPAAAAAAAGEPVAPADPIAAVWGDCRLSLSNQDGVKIYTVALLPDLGDKLTIAIAANRVQFVADRSQRYQARLRDNPPVPGEQPGRLTYTETWTLAPLPADFAPVWTLPKTADGKDFAEITLNAFGRDHLADRLVGQPAPALVVDSFPPVYDITFGPGLPAGWGPLPGIVAPRIMPHFDPLPTEGPKPIDWSEEPDKAKKIVAQPVTLGDLLKRHPNRPVALVFVASWTAAGQAALKDLAAWQKLNAPLLVVCNENTQTFVDDLGRRALPVSVFRDPQGRNGIRYGVDDYPMVYLIAPDRTIQSVQRGWAERDVQQLKEALRLP